MNAKLLFSVVILALSTQFVGCGRNDVSFSTDVQPILQKSCLECHNESGEGVAASGFSVANYTDVMAGTQMGPAVIPGSSISSTLYRVIAGKTDPEIRMPPHHSESLAEGRGLSLPQESIDLIARWIDDGAKDN